MKRLVGILVVLALLLSIFPVTHVALAAIILTNGDFETGDLNGWTVDTPPGGTVAVVTDFQGMYSPRNGQYFALLKPGEVADAYTTLSQTFTAVAGDKISGWAFFRGLDYMPFNDSGLVLARSGGSEVQLFYADIQTVGDWGATAWTYWEYTFTVSDTYILEAKVCNATDPTYDSFLGIDAILTNIPPSAEAGGPYTVAEGGAVQQDGFGIDPEGKPVTFAWDLDNNGSFETAGQSVTFSAVGLDGPGSYPVLFKVTDPMGAFATSTTSVEVTNVDPVMNTIPGATINEGAAYTASVSFTDPGPDSWSGNVNYGDGSANQALVINGNKTFTLNHVYADNGTYVITVNLSDNDGGTDTASASDIIVYNVAPTVDAGPDVTTTNGIFTATGSFSDTGADTWTATVDYGDGSGRVPLTLSANKTYNLSHTYTYNGSYTVTVTITDKDGGIASDTLIVTVAIVNLPPAAVSAGGPYTVAEGSSVQLNGSGSDPEGKPLTFAWDMNNDGTFEAAGQSVTFSAANLNGPGSATITLKVTDEGGLFSTAQATIQINNSAPAVNAGPDGATDANGVFSGSGSFIDVATDTWTGIVDYGDGTPTSPLTINTNKTFSLNHTYSRSGTYTVTVIITDNNGGAGSDTLIVTAALTPPPSVDNARGLKSSTIEKLNAARTGQKAVDAVIDRAIDNIKDSLDPKLWIDDNHLVFHPETPKITGLLERFKKQGSKDDDDIDNDKFDIDLLCGPKHGLTVFHKERAAVILLEGYNKITRIPLVQKLSAKKTGTSINNTAAIFEDVVKDLVNADMLLAKTAISDAKAIKVSDSNRSKIVAQEVDRAEKEYSKALESIRKDEPVIAISRFSHAWLHAQLAIKFAST